MQPKLLLSPAEVAHALGVCRATAYRLLDDGVIPSVRLGRLRMVRPEALEQRLAELERQ